MGPELFGRYLVFEQLGMGGMASVHRAEIAGVDGFRKQVALKRMLPNVAADEDMVASFVREARLASFLRHGNVAQTYELGKVEDIYFIAMELVHGRNLREVFKHQAQTTGTMPVPVALNLLNQICDALDYAHNLTDDLGQPLGIIHRDVTPSNILISDQGIVKLIDFGIAKASAHGMQTISGTIKGKFGYMAPEYLRGRIDARADLFALGVIAHEILTNRPLFSAGDDMETLDRIQHMEIQPPSRRNPDVPPEIDALVMTALARDPDQRWQQAHALRAALATETKRLGMEATNAEVVQWISFLYDHTGKNPIPRNTMLPADTISHPLIEVVPDAPSMIVEASAPLVLPPRTRATSASPVVMTDHAAMTIMPDNNPDWPPQPPMMHASPMQNAAQFYLDSRPSAPRISATMLAPTPLAHPPAAPVQLAHGSEPPASVLANYPRRHEIAPGFSAKDLAVHMRSSAQIAIPAESATDLAATTVAPAFPTDDEISGVVTAPRALPQAPVRMVAPAPSARSRSSVLTVAILLVVAAAVGAVVYFVLL